MTTKLVKMQEHENENAPLEKMLFSLFLEFYHRQMQFKKGTELFGDSLSRGTEFWGPFVQGDRKSGDRIGWGQFVHGDQIFGDRLSFGTELVGDWKSRGTNF